MKRLEEYIEGNKPCYVRFTLRLRSGLADRLEDAARRRGVSVNHLLAAATERALDELEEQDRKKKEAS